MSLPTASTIRWQPLRTGLVDLFYYDDQEFRFRDGRILFRGNNGTGKSKVLALTLPFLLDGELAPSRVEPDGDPGKRMEWNLLLGGRYEERLGYTWLEFGRITEDGEHAYLTVGCGLKAVKGKGIADRWFFLTSQRVGEELFLIGKNGTALTRDRLIEAVGLSGQVTQTAEGYRRLLDEYLFRLGLERYEALINLLIQLRQPQLSKRPDEKKLSAALSQALTPVDQALISDVAAAFHDLEQQREELAGLRDTREHVRRFLVRYQRYAAVAARRQSAELRLAHSSYEHVNRDLAAVAEQIEQAAQAEAEAEARAEHARDELAEQDAIKEELAGDSRIKDLDAAERYAEEAAKAVATAVETVERAQATATARKLKHEEATAATELSRRTVAACESGAAPLAERAGLAAPHATLLASLGTEPAQRVAGLDTEPAEAATRVPDLDTGPAEAAIRAAADARATALAHVTHLAETAAARERDLIQARTALTRREAERDAAADRLASAREELAAAVSAHVTAWRRYGLGLRETTLPDPEEYGLAAWAETLAGPHPGERALREAGQRAAQELAHAQAAATARRDQAEAALAELEAERDRLAAGEPARPRPPYTRAEGVRDGRPGAPLWALADFREDLDARSRAGLEAALEASGLLDAWVTPDGRLLDPGTHDVVALPGERAARPLSQALVTADPAARAVLDSIGVGEQAGPYVCADGRWRLGPLHGAWDKPAAEYLGATAREEARRRRLAELAALITEAEQALTDAGAVVDTLAARQETLSAELSGHPLDTDVRDAHAAVATAAERHQDAVRAVEEQAEEVRWAEDDLAAAVEERDRAAADTALPPDPAGLAEVGTALAAYRQAVTELLAAARLHAGKLAEAATWANEADAAEAEVSRARDQERDARQRAAQEQARLETLRASIGASVEDLRARLSETKARISALTTEIKSLEQAHRKAVEQRARAEGKQERLTAELAAAVERRQAAIDALRRFTETGLLDVACEVERSGSWAPDPAVRLARRIEQLLSDVDDSDDAWRRVQDEITRRYGELSEALSRHGHHAMAGLVDWFVVTIQFQGRERPLGELTELLDAEIDYRERTLTARQREIVEEHLVNDVAAHLQQLIADAEEQVAQMNHELEERPTSTGMKLRMSWIPAKDAPAGLAEARTRLLRQGADLWSPADRSAVADFLQAQIEAQRREDEHGTWAEHLRRALDYRTWHTFVIERYQDGRWRPATGPASGGERVLTVSLPLFAAASAHYRSAHPHAPRLVMLDEAFAGVDDDARAKCLGLLTTFDLDVAMTSEREWGFYPTVPGIATHQLVRRDGIDAVHVTTWEWDGVQAQRVERETSSRMPAAQEKPEDGLW
ncbi:TIGR02680 family protein [Thermoactinospora rubra]|uniref:TIGR02680 family protein n=1 Tax=Thermoactinospora rubra TaxID=1088767 RepID=UPI000A109A6B|nr:TIGR02680 family protein [Thermoactinospora rubra]